MDTIEIRHIGGREEAPLFIISNAEMTQEKSVSVPPPPTFTTKDGKTLSSELPWYLEDYLEAPFGAEKQRAHIVEDTLKAWGKDAFERLFTGHAYVWYHNARSDLSHLRIKIISSSPAILAWPWEVLWSGDDGFLAICCSIIRQPPDIQFPNVPEQQPTDELRMLFVIARPSGESDIGYHTLARSVTDYIRDEQRPVKIDVLRPPTFENLQRTLKQKQNYYHVVHFDGHGRYGASASSSMCDSYEEYHEYSGELVFEKYHGAEVLPDPVNAETIGQLLVGSGVPIMVLNACRSAMVDKRAEDPFASVAARLLKSGVRSVTAMGYKLYISGAKKFVPAFYESLFRDSDTDSAVQAGRRAMFKNKDRPSIVGSLPLWDWIVPELYQQLQPEKRLLPRIPETAAIQENPLPYEAQITDDYGFIGREAAIHELERIMYLQKQAGILIYGMMGMGKTTLVKGFLRWLCDTGGLDDGGKPCHVFWFDFRDVFSMDSVVLQLSMKLMDENALLLTPEARLQKLTNSLKARKTFIIWDNFESATNARGNIANLEGADREKIKTFLKNLRGGKTKVFITSRIPENWLATQYCARMKQTLDGLHGEELWTYCNAVVSDLGLSVNRNDSATWNLLKKLDGNPLAIRSILLCMNNQSPMQLAAELDKEFSGAVGDESTSRIMGAFHTLCQYVEDNLRSVLEVLELFEHHADKNWIISILGNMAHITRSSSHEAQDIVRETDCAFSLLESSGFCTRVKQNIYSLHPSLRSCLARDYPANEETMRWFVRWLSFKVNQAQHKPEEINVLFSWHEANILRAQNIAETLNMWEEDWQLTLSLAEFAENRCDSVMEEKWLLKEVKKAKQCGKVNLVSHTYGKLRSLASLNGNNNKAKKYAELALNAWDNAEGKSPEELFDYAVNARNQGDLSATEEYCKSALRIYEENGDWSQAAFLYGYLGGLAKKRNNIEAEIWYQKAITTAKRIGDKRVQAIASISLGSLYADVKKNTDAVQILTQGLDLAQEVQNPYMISNAYSRLGNLYFEAGYFDEAKKYLNKSLEIALQIKNEPTIARNYNTYGSIEVNTGDFSKAVRWFELALKIWEHLCDEKNASIARNNLAIAMEMLNNEQNRREPS